MLIRAIEDRDFGPIAYLTNHFIRTSAIHFGYEPVTADELRAPWAQTRDRYPWLAAEVDGRFAGFAKAGVWRERAAYQFTTETTVYVDPSFHRRGVGRTLYARVLDDLRARGFHTAIGGITLPNEASVALHEAMGFTKVAHFEAVGRKFDRWHDVGFWQLIL